MAMINDDDLMSRFDDVEVSTTRKVPICLVLDVSGSMGDRDGTRLTKIEELNKNYKDFLNFVRADKRARAICDLCVISFGHEVTVVNGYSNVESIRETKFTPDGPTPMGAAMKKALNLLELRRTHYKEKGIEYYKPILILMTDGEATDDYKEAAEEVSKKVKLKSGNIILLPFIIGQNNRSQALAAFSPNYQPKAIRSSEDFRQLFLLLQSSVREPAKDPWQNWMNGNGKDEGESV
jgi:uncharacterized protein YegL